MPTAFALVFTLDLHYGMLLAFLALGRERRVPRFQTQGSTRPFHYIHSQCLEFDTQDTGPAYCDWCVPPAVQQLAVPQV